MEKYNPQEIERKWQDRWEKDKIFKTPEDVTPENKCYILPQLPYPSGSGLHVGHAEVYTGCDIYARYQRMIGKKVLQVIGWDSFGLPAENYAIKTNVHPRKSTDDAIDNFRKQIKSLGISVDWDREVGSHNPDYYKWTQWFFLLMYKRGLAYRKKQSVNWCDSCKTVLANEQVTNEGACERCGTVVIQREMEQWYLKITDYADKLLEGLDRIDWPEETKKRQRDWIGRSDGASIKFKVESKKDFEIEVFTTRPDTLFGATYLVLAPEHSAIQNLESEINNWNEVETYIEETSKKTELDRQVQKEKTGVELKGVKAINPANGEEIPVWVADFVLANYGTGAVFADAHDERDFEFAKKYSIPLKVTIRPENEDEWEKVKNLEQCYTGDGVHFNSNFLDGLRIAEAKEKIIQWLEENKAGKRKVQYKLRDWSVSRQRFWGAPIPMLTRNGGRGTEDEERNKKYNYVLLHGYLATGTSNFRPWLKNELEKIGHTVFSPDLPNTEKPNVIQQAEHVMKNHTFDENTVIVAHSLGGPVAFRILEKLKNKIAKLVLVDTVLRPDFPDQKRPVVEASDTFEFDFEKIKKNADEFAVIADRDYKTIYKEHLDEMQKLFDARMIIERPYGERHFNGDIEPCVLEESIVSGLKPVPESDLPVILPDDVDFKPTGQSPLTYSEDFQKGVEKKYGKGWHREPDTLDTFMCSSWYYYRYLDPKNDEQFASPEALKKWMPVDFYLGGPEHVNGHLLYSRFFTKVLYDAGYIDFDEPFKVHRHQGLILGPDNRKMSKRWGNVINPTDVVNEFGADTMRMYEMFMGPLEDDKPWDTDGVKGVKRFLERVWHLQDKLIRDEETSNSKLETRELDKAVHKTIKKVGEDLQSLSFNTAIAKMMELINLFSKQEKIPVTSYQLLVTLLSPFAPHIAEELWSRLGNKTSVCVHEWPAYDPKFIVDDEVTLAVQVNGKLRDTITVSTDILEEDAKAEALKSEKVVKWMEGKEAKKVIYVKGKLISIVV